MGQVWAEWGDVLTVSALAVPVTALLAALIVATRRAAGVSPERARRATLTELGMLLGTAPWLWMILTPRGDGRALSPVPLRELVAQLAGDPSTAVVQIGGNLLVFAAFGALAPVRWGIGVRTVLVVAAGASVTVEALQYAAQIGRVTSVDDVLLNAAGAGLAAWATRSLRRRSSDTPTPTTTGAGVEHSVR
ncbi:VanZ family protein [Plantactinospora sp. B24E8]|uniref:VanZ family protein n=1 Tax=Plantactinospora sp. B24E8 TaxID=3153567 RepID=UPI00325E2812